MKIARLSSRIALRNFVSEGDPLETQMKSKQFAMMTLALSLAGATHAAIAGAPADAVIVTPKMLQVVRLQQQPLDAESGMTQSFNACTDAIRQSASPASRSEARELCTSALRTTRDYLREIAASPILHGTIKRTALSENMAAAYSNAALACWRAGDLTASRSHMQHARELAPTASFVQANAGFLMSEMAAANIAGR